MESQRPETLEGCAFRLILRALKHLRSIDEGRNDLAAPSDDARLSAANRARLLYAMRRRRDEMFGLLFGEPAWDILLDLFIADSEQRPISVSSLCIGAAVPPSTALRWIAELANRGLLSRHADPADGRRVYVEITSTARERLTMLLDQVPAGDRQGE